MCIFIQFWLCWVFIAAHSFSLVAVSRGYSSLGCTGLLLWWLLLLQSMGSRVCGLQQLWCMSLVFTCYMLQIFFSYFYFQEFLVYMFLQGFCRFLRIFYKDNLVICKLEFAFSLPVCMILSFFALLYSYNKYNLLLNKHIERGHP